MTSYDITLLADDIKICTGRSRDYKLKIKNYYENDFKFIACASYSY